MAKTILKSVRIRGDIKPKKVGGLDGNLILALIDDKDRRLAIDFQIEPWQERPNENFSGGVFYKKDYGDKTDDEIIKMYLSKFPKWSIIQDPFDPNVIPPDDNFTPQTNASTGIKYTADTTVSQESTYLTRQDNKPQVDSGGISVKSYSFIIQNPKNDDEKKVKLIIWIIDLEASSAIKSDTKFKQIYTGYTEASKDSNPSVDLPTSGNYYAISKILNAPAKNPKDGKDSSPNNIEEISPAGPAFYSMLQAKWADKSYTKPLNGVNDYIEYIKFSNQQTYARWIYNISISDATLTEDLKKFDLAENKIEFIQSSQASQEEVKPEPTAATESIQPLFAPDKVYTFNVEKSGFVSSPDIGTFSVVDVTPEFQFSNVDDEIPLDAEYTEEVYSGEEETASLVFFKETQSIEGAKEDTYVDPSSSGEKALVFNGKKFEEPDVKKRLNTTYYLYIDYKKMPKPKLTKQKLIDAKLKVEGGLTGNPNDSAAKTGYCPTLKNGQKYHTNKGVTYAVWKKTFGAKNDNRFLNMNLEDWSKIFNNSFWNVNATSKYESVNCLYTCFSWGGSKGATVTEAKKLLGVSDLDSTSEEEAVAALLSARAQLFINISQPGVDNNVFRRGWINGTNTYIAQTYF